MITKTTRKFLEYNSENEIWIVKDALVRAMQAIVFPLSQVLLALRTSLWKKFGHRQLLAKKSEETLCS